MKYIHLYHIPILYYYYYRMFFRKEHIKKNKKIIKYSILAILLALQSTDILHDHHDHDHDESHYCVACHAPNIDHDTILQTYNYLVDFVVITTIALILVIIKKDKLSPNQLPRSPPLT